MKASLGLLALSAHANAAVIPFLENVSLLPTLRNLHLDLFSFAADHVYEVPEPKKGRDENSLSAAFLT